MNVGDIMRKDPVYVSHRQSVVEAARIMRDNDFGIVPVEEQDRMVGMLTDRDIAVRVVGEGLDPAQTTAGDAMTDAVLYLFEDQDAEEAAETMQINQIRRLPVVNRDKRLVGMIGLSDLTQIANGHDQAGETLQQITRTA